MLEWGMVTQDLLAATLSWCSRGMSPGKEQL